MAIGLARLRGTGISGGDIDAGTGTLLDPRARDDDQDSSRSGNGFCSVVAGEAGLYLYIVRSSGATLLRVGRSMGKDRVTHRKSVYCRQLTVEVETRRCWK